MIIMERIDQRIPDNDIITISNWAKYMELINPISVERDV